MKRLLRTLLAAIGVLGLVMVGAVVFVTTFFDPEDLKPRLVEVVREHSGLELTLDGPLSWSFYPRLGVSVASAEARLASQSAEAAPFAAFDRAEVSMAFAPLLRGEIAIDGLTLDGLELNLARDADGKGNWQAPLERLRERGEQAEAVLAPASAGPNPQPEGEGGGESDLAVALNIARVQVRDGEVRYRDAQAGRELTLEQLEVTGTNVNPDRAFPLEAAFRLALHEGLDWREAKRPARLVSELGLKTRVSLGLAEGRHVLENPALTTSTQLEGREQSQEAQLTAESLVLDLGASQLGLAGGRLDVGLLSPRLGKKRLALALDFQLDADLAKHTAQLRELALSGPDGLALSGNLTLSELVEAPAYSGQLRLEPMSLRPWLIRLDAMPNMASVSALSEVALSSPVSGDLAAITLDGLTLTLDGSTFSGRLGGRFDGSRLAVDLQGDRLDLDAYLPPTDGAPSTVSRPRLPGIGRAYAEPAPALLPADWLAGVELDAQLALGELTLLEQVFRDVALTLEGRDGVHRLTSFESGFHDGRLAASGELDARETPLRWQLVPQISRVRLGSLLESLGDEPAPLLGRLNGEGRLASQGNSVPELKRALGGQLSTRLDEGTIPGVNVSRELCTAVARLEGESTSREWRDDTRFERAEASFRLRDGVAESDDLKVAIPGIELDGEGRFDVTSERFELRAAARFVDTVDAACEVNPRLVRVPFPVRCEGQLGGDSGEWCRFDRAAFQATLGELLREEAGQRVDEELDKQLEDAMEKLDERLGDDAGSELRDALEGLFK